MILNILILVLLFILGALYLYNNKKHIFINVNMHDNVDKNNVLSIPFINPL